MNAGSDHSIDTCREFIAAVEFVVSAAMRSCPVAVM